MRSTASLPSRCVSVTPKYTGNNPDCRRSCLLVHQPSRAAAFGAKRAVWISRHANPPVSWP